MRSPRLSDTDSTVEEYYYMRLKKMSVSERFQRMLSLCASGRELMKEAIKAKFPMMTHEERRIEFARRLYGDGFVKKYLLEKR